MRRRSYQHLLPVAILLLLMPEASASSQFKVCTITINSKQERELFQKNLSEKHFEFIELTDFGTKPTIENPDPDRNDFFEKACAAGVTCDVLVVSGHFAGTFFGTQTNLTLDIGALEKAACQKTCEGILTKPKEVFLFGCNTLASKEGDTRTPEEYLEVLLEDNIDRSVAERTVQARYGPLGSGFRTSEPSDKFFHRL